MRTDILSVEATNTKNTGTRPTQGWTVSRLYYEAITYTFEQGKCSEEVKSYGLAANLIEIIQPTDRIFTTAFR